MYYGKYRGVVKDTSDPEKRGRIRVECPAVLGKQLSNWALPCLPPNCFSIPSLNTMVWVEFEGGRKDSPIWTGVFYTTDQRKNLFQDSYNTKNFLISSKNKLIVRTVSTAEINLASGTGTTKFGTIDANRIMEDGQDI